MVLPLENLSGDPTQDFFADGMTEALIADLAKIEGLRVISRTSAMRYKGARRPLPGLLEVSIPRFTGKAQYASRVWFRDPEERYFVQIQNQLAGQIVVNADYVRPEEITGGGYG